MQISNIFLDTCVAIKRLQEDEEGDDVRKFLEDKIQHMTTYSIKEFKKSFVRSVIYLEYMIEEGRTIREIYQDISDMKIDKDSNISKLGRRLEILMAMIGNPDKIAVELIKETDGS